jgi:hypothetical protein
MRRRRGKQNKIYRLDAALASRSAQELASLKMCLIENYSNLSNKDLQSQTMTLKKILAALEEVISSTTVKESSLISSLVISNSTANNRPSNKALN